MDIRKFPVRGNTFAIDVTATASTSKALPREGFNLRLVNEGAEICFVSAGVGSQTATVPDTTNAAVTCTPVLPGKEVVLRLPESTTGTAHSISAICRSTKTTTLIVSVGEGD